MQASDPVASLPVLRCETGPLPMVVEVLDARGERIGLPAIGDTERTDLPFGVYVVRFSIGKCVETQAVAMTSTAEPYVVSPDRKRFDLAMSGPNFLPWPLLLSDQFPQQAGQGQVCVVFSDACGEQVVRDGRLAFEDADGRVVKEIGADSLFPRKPFAVCRFWAGEGAFQLVAKAGSAGYSTVLPVPVLPGMRTLVLLPTRSYGSERAADLARAGMYLVGKDQQFDPDTPEQREHEALAALLEHRLADGCEFGRNWSAGWATDPLARVYAAHLMLRAAAPDVPQLYRVVLSLRDDFGWSADVRSLAWAVIAQAPGGLFASDLLEKVRVLEPLDHPPFVHDACPQLLAADKQFGDVLTPALRDMLAGQGDICSRWFVRKRLERPELRPDIDTSLAVQSASRLAAAVSAAAAAGSLSGAAATTARLFGGSLIDFLADSLAASQPEQASEVSGADQLAALLARLPGPMLNRLADQLSPLQRQLAEAVYPALNPLNRYQDALPAAVSLAAAAQSLAQAWAERRGISVDSERAKAYVQELSRCAASIAERAAALVADITVTSA